MAIEQFASVISGAASALAGVYLSHRFEWFRTTRQKEIEQLQAYFSILEHLRIELCNNTKILLEFFYHSERIIEGYGDANDFDRSPKIREEWSQLLGSEGPYQFPDWPGWEITTDAYERFIHRGMWQMSATETKLSYLLNNHYRLLQEWKYAIIRERTFLVKKEESFLTGQSMENTVWQCKVCIEELPNVGAAFDQELIAVANKYVEVNNNWLQKILNRSKPRLAVKTGPIGREKNWNDYKIQFDSINVRKL